MVSLVAMMLAAAGLLTFEKGPVRGTVEVVPNDPISVADLLRVQVTMIVPAVPEAEMLETGNKRRYRPEPPHRALSGLAQFHLKGIETPISGEVRDGMVVDTWSYLLEPRLPGSYEIPELTLIYWPNEDSTIPLTITTTPIPVIVKSVVTGNPLEADIHPAAPLGTKKSDWKRWLLVGLIIVIWLVVRQRYAKRRTPNAEGRDAAQQQRKRFLAEFDRAKDAAEVQDVLDRFVLETYGLEMSKLTADELRNHPTILDLPREELAQIKAELEKASFAKGDGTIDPPLRERIRELMESVH